MGATSSSFKELHSSLMSSCVQDIHFSHFLLGTTPPEVGPFEAPWHSAFSECMVAEKPDQGLVKQISRLHVIVSQTNLAWSNIAEGLKHKLL